MTFLCRVKLVGGNFAICIIVTNTYKHRLTHIIIYIYIYMHGTQPQMQLTHSLIRSVCKYVYFLFISMYLTLLYIQLYDKFNYITHTYR